MAQNLLEHYQARLLIDKHRLDDQLEEQAQILDEIGQHRAKAASALTQAKESLSTYEAQIYLDAKNGGLSDTAAKSAVSADRGRRSFVSEHTSAREEFEAWESLYEAWKARGYALSKLADLHNGSYFAHTQTSAGRRSSDIDRDAAAASETVRAIREAQARVRDEKSNRRRHFTG